MTEPVPESLHPATVRFARHVNPAFVKLLGTFGYGRVFERAAGMHTWDATGREYLDFLGGFGAVNLGHNHPALVEVLVEALRAERPNLVHVGPQIEAGELAERLARLVPGLPMSVFASSGGEAVEAALKIARVVTGRPGYLYCAGGFHGTGFGSLSVMGSARMREPFQPLLAHCDEVPFGDLPALERALTRRHAALLLEPIQAEGGVNVAPDEYLREAKRLCERAGALLIADEVQTGVGRTGRFLAVEHDDVVPDLVVLGKALGGSIAPISAVLTTERIHAKAFGSMDTFDLCSTTFAGNAFACRAAIATVDILAEEGLCARAGAMGDRLLAGLRTRLEGHPLVKEVRGRGLLVGVELGPRRTERLVDRLMSGVVEQVSEAAFGQWLAVRLLERGILAQPASQQWNVLRLEPPLVVTEAQIDHVVGAIGDVLDEYRELRPLLVDLGRRLGRQVLRRGRFG